MKATLGKSVAKAPRVVASPSEEFSSASQQISASVVEASRQDNLVSNIGLRIKCNLHTTAVGSEERSISIEELARNTLEAAIHAIQTDFTGAIDAIGAIGLGKPQFNDLSNSPAVEEPNTTTDEMSHNGIEANIGKAVGAGPSI